MLLSEHFAFCDSELNPSWQVILSDVLPPLQIPQHRWTCLIEQRLTPRRTAYDHICRMLKLLCNAGFLCSCRMNFVWKPLVRRGCSPAPWPLYCVRLPGWGSLPAWSASHESSWSGQCADGIRVKSGEKAGENQYASCIWDFWRIYANRAHTGVRVLISTDR